MNYKQLINKEILKANTGLLSEIIFIYYDNKKQITKKDVLSELPGIRELKKSEVDIIYNNAIKMVKQKYNIDIIGLIESK